MEYVIRHCESGKYLSLVKLRNEAVWVDLDKAHRFSDRQKVDNFMRMNFNNAVKGQIRKSEVEILPSLQGIAGNSSAPPSVQGCLRYAWNYSSFWHGIQFDEPAE